MTSLCWIRALVALINKALSVKALAKEHTCLTFTGSHFTVISFTNQLLLHTGSLWTILQVYWTSPTIYSHIIIGLSAKWLSKDVPGAHVNVIRYRHKDHMQSVPFFTFPRPVMEDQNHLKTVLCWQCIKPCGRLDHQLNMDMIIQDFIVKINHYYRICHKVCDSEPNLCEHVVDVPELGL